ncbi:MAG: fatty acid desaturase [Burkholderiaceae bacterium]
MDILDFLDGGLLQFSWWQVLLAGLVMTQVTIAGVTIYLHRSQAHRALDLHPAVALFFRTWLWLSTAMLTHEWVAIHRKHHAKCETPDDPHSPQTRGLKTVLLRGAELYRAEAENPETIARFRHGTPTDWIERRVFSRFPTLGVALMLVINVALFGVLGIVVWAVQMMWIPIHAAGVINGIGHFWGYRNFDAPDASTNILPVGFWIGGEELHNNHHTFPTSAKFSVKWYEFDIGWTYIRVLSALRLATVLRRAPVPTMAEPKGLVDSETLQAVIANRYDLLAKYARALRGTYKEEIKRLGNSPAVERARQLSLKRSLRLSKVDQLPADHQMALRDLMAQSKAMATMVEMRTELAAIWERSSSSREQMLANLQDWIARAEASGIRALQDAALRIRRYRLVAVA